MVFFVNTLLKLLRTEIPKLSDLTNCANVDPVFYSTFIRVVTGTVAARLVTHGTRDITPIFLYGQALSDLEGNYALSRRNLV